MTRTEDRLIDALGAAASRVRDDRLRPLPDRDADVAVPRWGTAWRHWLAPAAAAACVALVIGVIVGVGHQTEPRSGPSVSTAPARPSYVVMPATDGGAPTSVMVRTVTTGKVVGSLPAPVRPDVNFFLGPVAAGPDDRTFFVAYNVIVGPASTDTDQVWIYRFALASSGKLTPMTRVAGGVLPGYVGTTDSSQMVVSPDGTQLALAVGSGKVVTHRIVVVHLRTGLHTTWRGGLTRSGMLFGITALSWAADGRSLVFSATWCTPVRGPEWCVHRDDEVFSLDPADGGGSLNSARPLLRQSARYPLIVAAYAGPHGSDIVAVVLSGSIRESKAHVTWSDLEVLDISPASGAVIDVLYRRLGSNNYGAWLAPDPSDRYFLLDADDSSPGTPAWIAGGKPYPLAFPVWQVSW